MGCCAQAQYLHPHARLRAPCAVRLPCGSDTGLRTWLGYLRFSASAAAASCLPASCCCHAACRMAYAAASCGTLHLLLPPCPPACLPAGAAACWRALLSESAAARAPCLPACLPASQPAYLPARCCCGMPLPLLMLHAASCLPLMGQLLHGTCFC